MGAAEGSVDFSSKDAPEVKIKDIQSYLGMDIDYSSGIEVKNTEIFEDFQMWVDATNVDIYTVGKYMATYKFIYDGNELERTVSVTILENENEESPGDSQSTGTSGENPGNYANTDDGSEDNSGSGNSNHVNSSDNNDNSSNANSNNINNNHSNNNSNSSNTNSNNSNINSNNNNNSSSNNTPIEIITSAQKATKKPTTVGYTNIELLSGKYVKLKCTSDKYIVSTRTDVSDIEKNGKTYQVSKLIITYNTGAEQVLETVEKVVNKS